ncbi:MAG: ATP-binding cassette domain-containing protein [Cyanobacteria bacterium SZAS LIN-3]|nr:ATP-binding cassette domain-containing protein [Cyanobacteria bacterium SZAS LIN-3]
MACQDISFAVSDGEIFGLLGPNGAGKTTTLRIIATILTATTGKATLDGVDVFADSHKARAMMGFLSSSTGLYDRLTPAEILHYFGRLCGLTEAEVKARTAQLAQSLDFEKYVNVRCAGLSQGTRQKVSIARAIVHNPKLMILDEPSTGLDVLATQSMHDFILAAKAQEKAILLSTHSMDEAEKLCDRIGIINDGKLLAVGTIDELRAVTGKSRLEDVFVTLVRA